MIGVIIQFIILFFAMGTVPCVQAMNLLRPYDILIRPEYPSPQPERTVWWQPFIIAEGGIGDIGFDDDAHHVDVTKIWQCTQDALAMLDGFPSEGAIGKKLVAVDANDDGIRGHFSVGGKLNTTFAGSITLRSFFLNHFH